MSRLRPNDPYHQRDAWLTPDKALDKFRDALVQSGGDEYAAAALLAEADPHAAKVLDSAFTFEQAVELANAYTETADGNGDGELLDIHMTRG